MVTNFLRLALHKPAWMPQLIDELRQLLTAYNALAQAIPDKDPLELLSVSLIRRWVPYAWDFVTSCMEDNRLPKIYVGDNS